MMHVSSKVKSCCTLARIGRYKPDAVIYKDDIGRLNDVFIVLTGQCTIAQRLQMKVSIAAGGRVCPSADCPLRVQGVFNVNFSY